MTKVSRHTYTAENDLGTVLSVPGGTITLDSSDIPHVKARLTLSVEDAALLDELDPRDSRRITIGATGDGHEQRNYTPWVEKRKNWHTSPRNGGTVSGGLAQGNNTYIAASGTGSPSMSGAWQEITATSLPTATVSRYGFRRSQVVTAPTDALITVKITARGVSALPANVRARVYADFNDGGTFRGTITSFLAADGETTVTGRFPAGPVTGVNFYVWLDTSSGTFSGSAKIGVTDALIEVTTSGDPFDGSTEPSGELQRTRWLGAANASASVVETRALLGVEWVPEGFRYFDLGIRKASPNRADGTVDLELASDEAILSDFAQLADDNGARAHQGSMRAVCNYVLGKIGAALEPGGPDADMTPYWEVTNLLANPSGEVDAASWLSVGSATAISTVVMTSPAAVAGSRAIRWTAGGASSNIAPVAALSDFTVQPGRWYVFSAYVATSVAGRTARAILQWRNANGTVVVNAVQGVDVSTTTTEFRRISVIGRAPAGATHVLPYIQIIGGVSGNLYYADAAMFHEGTEVIPYHDGSTGPAGYTFAWQDLPHKSASTRTPLVERRPEALLWPAGVSGMEFLHSLLQAAGLRLVCDELRRWSTRAPDYRADGVQNYRHKVNIEAAREELSREGDAWFDAAVYEYVWTDDAGIEQRRVDAFALVTPPTKVLRVELRDTPFPGPGRAQNIVMRAQGRGRTVTATAIPTWQEQTDQPLAVLLEGTPIQTGIAGSVTFDLDNDTVTATSRTTDTPDAAWILIPDGERWIDSPPGESWTEETP